MACFLTINRMYANREARCSSTRVPVQKQHCRVLGHDYMTFDVYDYRGPKLRDKLKSFLDTGKVSSILYFQPEQSGVVLPHRKRARDDSPPRDQYDVVVIEDLAYFAWTSGTITRAGRRAVPAVGRAAHRQVRAAHLQFEGVQLRGERIGMLVVSDAIWTKRAPEPPSVLPVGSAGLCVGVRRDLLALVGRLALRAVRPGGRAEGRERRRVELRDGVREYGEKAHVMKRMFTDNGFRIVYDSDLDAPLPTGSTSPSPIPA